MTQVERLARELLKAGGRYYGVDWKALACHVLRRERAAVRRARGRTIGWCAIPKDRHPVADYVAVSRCRYVHDTARVVAVPRKGGRRG